jgi:hypothetical protein
MSIAVVGCHYGVNELVMYFMKDKARRSIEVRAVLLSVKTFV